MEGLEEHRVAVTSPGHGDPEWCLCEEEQEEHRAWKQLRKEQNCQSLNSPAHPEVTAPLSQELLPCFIIYIYIYIYSQELSEAGKNIKQQLEAPRSQGQGSVSG